MQLFFDRGEHCHRDAPERRDTAELTLEGVFFQTGCWHCSNLFTFPYPFRPCSEAQLAEVGFCVVEAAAKRDSEAGTLRRSPWTICWSRRGRKERVLSSMASAEGLATEGAPKRGSPAAT